MTKHTGSTSSDHWQHFFDTRRSIHAALLCVHSFRDFYRLPPAVLPPRCFRNSSLPLNLPCTPPPLFVKEGDGIQLSLQTKWKDVLLEVGKINELDLEVEMEATGLPDGVRKWHPLFWCRHDAFVQRHRLEIGQPFVVAAVGKKKNKENIKALQVTSVLTVAGATLRPSRWWRLTSSCQNPCDISEAFAFHLGGN